MATGMLLPFNAGSLATAISGIREFLIVSSIPPQQGVQLKTNSIWTPPQYSQPALTLLSTIAPPYSLTPTQGSPVSVNYVFDAVFRVLHRRVVRKTSHPVLTGANISDHAYVEPARVTLEIGMSDSMASFSYGYLSAAWTNAATKSISAWQVMRDLAIQKTLMTLTTRLDTYTNMMIVEIESPDDNKTRHGLRATIILEELLSASVVSIPASSARSDTTDSSNGGTFQATEIPVAQAIQHTAPTNSYVPPFAATDIPPQFLPPVTPYVPGAGVLSSNLMNYLRQ